MIQMDVGQDSVGKYEQDDEIEVNVARTSGDWVCKWFGK